MGLARAVGHAARVRLAVQVATGIAAACAAPDGTPGVLPAQALDHATGHLMAAAALRALAARERGEPVRSARLSLARTAAELLAAPRRDEPARTPDPERFRVAFGDVELIAPPGALDGVPLAWAHGPRPPRRRRPGLVSRERSIVQAEPELSTARAQDRLALPEPSATAMQAVPTRSNPSRP